MAFRNFDWMSKSFDIASVYRVNLSMIVSQYFLSPDFGSGPIISTLIYSNQFEGGAIDASDDDQP